MWTEQTRTRQAKRTAPRKRYPSDLTDAEWEFIAPLLPKPALRGRRRVTDLRDVLNAIRYLVRSGCEWRMLPTHFPPWQTVYWWFRRLVRSFLFQVIHDLALMLDRQAQGRDEQPTAAVIDSQTIKAPGAARRGYDAAKRINGRKRHIAVDADGRLLMVRLTPADIADSSGALAVGQTFVCRCCVRSAPIARQGGVPRLCGRGCAPLGRSAQLCAIATPLGGGAHIRLDDALATPGA